MSVTRRHLAAALGIALTSTAARAQAINHPPYYRCPFVPRYSGCEACFLKGTRLMTARGEIPVEEIAAGELLLTRDHALQPVVRVISDVRVQRPVCFCRSALAHGIPHADLCVSPGHAICVDGILIYAINLINGRSICWHYISRSGLYEYVHVELPKHEVISANGAPCESLATKSHRLPVVADGGGRARIMSHLRSAMAPWIDLRRPLDCIRDRLAA